MIEKLKNIKTVKNGHSYHINKNISFESKFNVEIKKIAEKI